MQREIKNGLCTLCVLRHFMCSLHEVRVMNEQWRSKIYRSVRLFHLQNK